MRPDLRAPYEWGRSRARSDVPTWLAIVALAATCATVATLAFALLPASGGGLAEAPIPAGSWTLDWSPTVELPTVQQRYQLLALRYAGAGTSGLLAVLCALIVAALWGQRLRLRREVHFAHWAVGANRSQLLARLWGESRIWVAAVAVTSAVGVVVVAALVRRTFPGDVTMTVEARASLIVLAGLAVALARWERIASSGPIRPSGFRAYDLLGSPTVIGVVGVATLCGVGLLTTHLPYADLAALPTDDAVVGVSLEGVPETTRGRVVLDLLGALADAPAAVGLASAGAVRGAGRTDTVATECGHCVEGLMPMPIKQVRAEVHAVAQDTFTHLGLRLVRGRDFDVRVDAGGPPTAIVSEALAGRHFESGQALGRRIRVGHGAWATVVGIVEDAADVETPTDYAVYVPVSQAMPTELEVMVPPSGGAMDVALAEVVRSGGAVSAPRTRAQVFGVHRWFGRLLTMLGITTCLALAVGLSVSAASEARATWFEVGLRRAVGARRIDLRRHYVGWLLRRLAAVALGGAWLSLFVGAGLGKAYGAIPQVDGSVLGWATAWVALLYLAGSLPSFRRARAAPLMESLRALS